MSYVLSPSTRSEKKWMVKLPTGKTIHFGAEGYQDYTMHRDPERKRRYIERHSRPGRENWTKSGLDTPGFWSRWLLWNLPTLSGSKKDIEKRFKVKIVLQRI